MTGDAGGVRRAPVAERDALALPPQIKACLLDLDGVVTSTATVHAAAWKNTFDEFLAKREPGPEERLDPFDEDDYRRFVDGRPRREGVRAFLASRGIHLPEGAAGDRLSDGSVEGLANAKNERVLAAIAAGGVESYPGSMRFLLAASEAGLALGVVSASANTHAVLAAVALEAYFDVVIDGVAAARRKLRGKPEPDTYLAAAQDLGVAPGEAAVFDDALAGVHAARAGGFGLVVGVDRTGDRAELLAEGADLVVADLAELVVVE